MADETKERNRAGGFVPVLIGAGITVVVGLGAGFGAASYLTQIRESTVADAAAKSFDNSTLPPTVSKEDGGSAGVEMEPSEGADIAEGPEVETALVPLPPVVTNMAAPASTWIRLEGSVEYDKASDKRPEVLAAETAQAVLHYLRTIRLADIQSPDGIHFVSQDIDEIVRTLSEGQVRSVLITGLVVE